MKKPALRFMKPLNPHRWDVPEPEDLKRQADYWQSILQRPDGTWPNLDEALRITEGMTYPPRR